MSQKKITIILQARTGSKRFPRKVLAKIEKQPMIWHVINRVKATKKIQQIVLTTTKKKEDRILLKIAKENKIHSFTGKTNDVLNRYYQCALLFNADPIIRITADCPLIDAKIIEKILDIYTNHKYDYVTNIMDRSFPEGLDVEIFSFDTLKKANQYAKLKSEREHVTPYIKNNPQKFKLFNMKNELNFSELRWSVDYKKDLKFVRKIYSELKPKKNFFMRDILKIISKNPDIIKINTPFNKKQDYFDLIKNIKIKF